MAIASPLGRPDRTDFDIIIIGSVTLAVSIVLTAILNRLSVALVGRGYADETALLAGDVLLGAIAAVVVVYLIGKLVTEAIDYYRYR